MLGTAFIMECYKCHARLDCICEGGTYQIFPCFTCLDAKWGDGYEAGICEGRVQGERYPQGESV